MPPTLYGKFDGVSVQNQEAFSSVTLFRLLYDASLRKQRQIHAFYFICFTAVASMSLIRFSWFTSEAPGS